VELPNEVSGYFFRVRQPMWDRSLHAIPSIEFKPLELSIGRRTCLEYPARFAADGDQAESFRSISHSRHEIDRKNGGDAGAGVVVEGYTRFERQVPHSWVVPLHFLMAQLRLWV
jgi:hypothetical protein